MQQPIGTQRVCVFVTVHKLRGLPNSIETGHDWLQGICASFALNDGRRRSSPGRESSKGRLWLKLPDPRKRCWSPGVDLCKGVVWCGLHCRSFFSSSADFALRRRNERPTVRPADPRLQLCGLWGRRPGLQDNVRQWCSLPVAPLSHW